MKLFPNSRHGWHVTASVAGDDDGHVLLVASKAHLRHLMFKPSSCKPCKAASFCRPHFQLSSLMSLSQRRKNSGRTPAVFHGGTSPT